MALCQQVVEKMREISIARDFTKFPGGRYRKHGEGSGEEFREDFLVPAIAAGGSVTIDFQGTFGYPASFIEEAFGGLVRAGFALATLKRQLVLQTADPKYQVYVDQAWQYIGEAGSR
jgi:hypothetical protein